MVINIFDVSSDAQQKENQILHCSHPDQRKQFISNKKTMTPFAYHIYTANCARNHLLFNSIHFAAVKPQLPYLTACTRQPDSPSMEGCVLQLIAQMTSQANLCPYYFNFWWSKILFSSFVCYWYPASQLHLLFQKVIPESTHLYDIYYEIYLYIFLTIVYSCSMHLKLKIHWHATEASLVRNKTQPI